MKAKYMWMGLGLLMLTGCTDLDQDPLSMASSENFYSSAEALQMAANDGYRMIFWPPEGSYGMPFFSSDWIGDMLRRETLRDFLGGTLNGQSDDVTKFWTLQYKLISRMNSVINKYPEAIANGASEATVEQILGQCYFNRACAYGKLASHMGDVPLVTEAIDIDEALKRGRTPVSEIKELIYSDFDNAVQRLPESYAGIQYATKGAALGMKARYALFFKDYKIAAEAAKGCMDLGVYKLNPDFGHLFATTTKTDPEFVFVLQRSFTLGNSKDWTAHEYIDNSQASLPRMVGGWVTPAPSWDLLAMFTCTDGKAIDKSPLFDPHKPFDNRDPRCSETIIPFGEKFMGVVWDPSKKKVWTDEYNREIKNSDCLLNEQYASYTGLALKKGMDEGMLANGNKADPAHIILRYADVLLMYAEAKVELGEIDNSVIDALNTVRSRAYKCDKSETSKYPAFTAENQETMRHKIRVERHMELAYEYPIYMDFMRWRLMGKKLKGKFLRLYTDKKKFQKYLDDGNWFWPITPKIDEDGIADFSEFVDKGLCDIMSDPIWPEDNHMYLWPIPTADILINENLTQNPGY